MLNTLPKLVDKQFVIGFIVPILIGVSSLVWLLSDVKPFSSVYSLLTEGGDPFAKLSIFILTLWSLAIILLLLNYPLYRFLEGYWGPFACEKWSERMRTEFDKEMADLDREYATTSDEVPGGYNKALERFRKKWPFQREFVLPTRFGNVIRAAETYSLKVYGADSIAVWARMEALIQKEFHALVADAQSQIDFLINLWFFAVLFAIGATARSLFALYLTWRVPVTTSSAIWELFAVGGFMLAATVATLLAWVAYRLAIEQAKGWGELFRSAFDLYLPALAKQLGYELPATERGRKRFWNAVNDMFLYHVPLRPECWSKATPADKTADTKAIPKDEQEDAGEPEIKKLISAEGGSRDSGADACAEHTKRSTKDKRKGDGESGIEEITPVDGE